MAEPKRSTASKKQSASLSTTVTELWELVLAYAKQETVEPLKALGRYVAFGVAGGLFISIGGVLLGVGGLRAIQSETNRHLSGDWTWAPYLAVSLLFLVVAGLALTRVGKVPEREDH